jgi:hypothetical protein
MAKTILVTGAAGFLGSHICKELLNRKYEVIGVDNLLGGDKDNIPFLNNFYKLDCADFKSMLKITKDIDVLFHCAATAHEGLSVFSPYTITQNNIMATVGVATAAIQNGVKRIIYCSSMARYGDQQSPFTEDMPTKPVDPYGISKVAGEEILKTFDNADDAYNMEAKIVNEEWIRSGNSYNVALGGRKAGKPSKYSHLFAKWKSLYESGMTMKEIAKITGLSSHATISINLDNIVTKRKKYLIANKARQMKLFCIELGKHYNSQKDFLLETFGDCKSVGNLSVAIKNGLKFRGLTVVRA